MARKIKVDNALLKRFASKEKKRSIGTKSKQVFILIVSEGTKTEPNYFEAIRAKFPRGIIDTIDIEGTAKNTLTIIEECVILRDAAKNRYRIYDEVWAVFDKDSFPDKNFNNAINRAESMKEKINCAWSNEAFELWYLLHFQFVNTGMNREQYKPFIERELSAKIGKPFKYKKNSKEMYELLQQYGNESQAIEWAKRLEELYDNKDFATHNPCTMVYKLVNRLNSLMKK
jgi:hypothetical protein